MTRLAGEWGPVTLDGPREILVDGFAYGVPEHSEVRVVLAYRGVRILHVRHPDPDRGGPVVSVLSQGRQLIEDANAATLRAHDGQWRAIDGDLLKVRRSRPRAS